MNCYQCQQPLIPNGRYCGNCGCDNAAYVNTSPPPPQASAAPLPSPPQASASMADNVTELLGNFSEMSPKRRSLFFSFLDPVLNAIDSGAFFKRPMFWVYRIISFLHLLLPILVLIMGASKFEYLNGQAIFAFILAWLVICFVAWIAFQLWFSRASHLNKSIQKDSEFVATPIFGHFIQTLGESLGLTIGVGGFVAGLIFLLFAGEYAGLLAGSLNIPANNFMQLLTLPLLGFFIVIFFRFIAEQIKTFSAIANNTKRLL
jgi:hypothetical protein